MFIARKTVYDRNILFSILPSLIYLLLAWSNLDQQAWARTTLNFPEGNDFATKVMRTPWNMSDYSEISQAINHAGQMIYLQNIKVEDGIFSARSANNDAQFYPLFPGYWTAMLLGKVGHNYPIKSGTYKYLYIAMKVDSGPPNPYPDALQIFWFADERQNVPGAVWGYSQFIPLHPESGYSAPNPVWKLYKIDLSSPQVHLGETPWTGNSTWQGLRIDPTIQANVNFQVDWVRLTDAAPVPLPLSFNCGSGSCSVWVRPSGTNREILIESKITSPYNLDLQGIPPGEYEVMVKNGTTVIQTASFTVNAAPLVNFLKPSPSGSQEYSVLSGNPWDMGNPSDVQVECAGYSFQGGMLHLSTPTGAAQPSGCWGGVAYGSPISDPRVVLNTPVPFNAGDYRYLSFRMYTEAPWQDIVRGMMARWIWTVQGPGGPCSYVSQDIPYDVGWQTYTIDLFDAFNGSPETVSGGCPATSWKNSGSVVGLRFDPNENILGYPLNQKIDWIKLHKEDRSPWGTNFPIRISLNKSPSEVQLSYFYTTDPTNYPTQQMAQPLPSAPLSGAGMHKLFLPLVTNTYDPSYLPPPNSVTFDWDTSKVNPGKYYICVTASDSSNQTTYCSDTPTIVY
jgi:hypothetical protein